MRCGMRCSSVHFWSRIGHSSEGPVTGFELPTSLAKTALFLRLFSVVRSLWIDPEVVAQRTFCEDTNRETEKGKDSTSKSLSVIRRKLLKH
jgi:hypothetical protein